MALYLFEFWNFGRRIKTDISLACCVILGFGHFWETVCVFYFSDVFYILGLGIQKLSCKASPIALRFLGSIFLADTGRALIDPWILTVRHVMRFVCNHFIFCEVQILYGLYQSLLESLF